MDAASASCDLVMSDGRHVVFLAFLGSLLILAQFAREGSSDLDSSNVLERRASLLFARTLLVAPGLTTRSKKLLVTKGIATSSVLAPSSNMFQ